MRPLWSTASAIKALIGRSKGSNVYKSKEVSITTDFPSVSEHQEAAKS